MSHDTLSLLAFGGVLLATVACSSSRKGQHAPPCERAKRCCHAYVEAAGADVTVEQACSGIDAAQEAGASGEQSCRSMVPLWQRALEQAGTDVPPACQD